jgi:hypothetical protein
LARGVFRREPEVRVRLWSPCNHDEAREQRQPPRDLPGVSAVIWRGRDGRTAFFVIGECLSGDGSSGRHRDGNRRSIPRVVHLRLRHAHHLSAAAIAGDARGWGDLPADVFRERRRAARAAATLTWSEIPPDYADQIWRVRHRLGLTQGQLAARMGAARKAVVYQWESRKRCPSPLFWRRILDLGVADGAQ